MARGNPFDFAGHGWRFERGDVKYVILDLLAGAAQLWL